MDEQNKKEKITTMDELTEIINGGFQTNQEYMDKKFGELNGEISGVKEDLKEVKEKLNKVDKKLGGFINTYHEEKLPMRMGYIENMLNVPKK